MLSLGLSLFWILLCMAIYYGLEDGRFKVFLIRSRLTVSFLVTLSLLVRLVPAVLLPGGAAYDIESFERVADTLIRGEGVYSSSMVQGRHPYFPFQMYFIVMAMLISKVTGWPFAFVVKWAPIIADGAISALIFRTYVNINNAETGIRRAVSYALNPVSLLVSAYHGQFDAVPVFLLALSWYWWCFGKEARERIGWSALALGLGILDKTWPLLFLPIVLLRLKSWSKRLKYAFICMGVPFVGTALYLLVFPIDTYPLFRRALTHAGVPGWWGMSAIANVILACTGQGEAILNWMAIYGRWPVFICIGIILWLSRTRSTIQALVMVILALYASTSGFGLQWGLWVIPFALLSGNDDSRWVKRYVAALLLHLLPSYFGYHLDPSLAIMVGFQKIALVMQISAIPAWLITLFWLSQRLFANRAIASESMEMQR